MFPLIRDERDDKELVRSFFAGDLAAFDVLFSRYWDRLKKFHYIRHPRDFEDITQETFIRVIRKLAQFDPDRGSFQCWLYKVAATTRVDYYRRHLVKWDFLNFFSEFSVTPDQPEYDKDELSTRDLLKPLSDLDQEIIFLYLDGHTDPEISEILSARSTYRRLAPYNPKSIATRRARALAKLSMENS